MRKSILYAEVGAGLTEYPVANRISCARACLCFSRHQAKKIAYLLFPEAPKVAIALCVFPPPR